MRIITCFKRKRLPLGLALLVIASSVGAQTEVSSTGTGNQNWANGGNWSCACNPNSTAYNVTIQGGHVINQNVGNLNINNLTVEAGATLYIQDGQEIYIHGNLTLNGTIVFQDGGNIESDGVRMEGNGRMLSGTGSFYNSMSNLDAGDTKSLFIFNNTTTIAAGTELRFYSASDTYVNMMQITSGITVTNNGTIRLEQLSLVGAASSSTWINKNGAYLYVGRALLATGTLTANEVGNTV
ncbi:MAG: hypothetical protein HC842_03905, partial [Cytophagales bacterium]|nr:hypothetical protein [Cytophagales bacterium]